MSQAIGRGGDGGLVLGAFCPQAVPGRAELACEADELSCESLECAPGDLERLPAGGRVRAGRFEPGEAPLHLRPAAGEQGQPLLEPGASYRELGSERRQRTGTLVKCLAGSCGLLGNGESLDLGPFGFGKLALP